MLSRKPRKGDLIENVKNYKEYINDDAPPIWKALGTVLRCDGNICWYQPVDENKKPDCFIWWFREGLNKLTRIKEKQ